MTHAQLKQLYLLTAAKIHLLGDGGDVDEDEVAQWSVEQTAHQLSRLALHAEALRLLHAFDCDCAPVFDQMAQTLLFAESETSWHALQALVADYDGVDSNFRCARCCRSRRACPPSVCFFIFVL